MVGQRGPFCRYSLSCAGSSFKEQPSNREILIIIRINNNLRINIRQQQYVNYLFIINDTVQTKLLRKLYYILALRCNSVKLTVTTIKIFFPQRQNRLILILCFVLKMLYVRSSRHHYLWCTVSLERSEHVEFNNKCVL